ncbi:MAG: helix-turn-helix transcriptional regulator [Eggerthellaceae bacterium]|nr:helix-turn-helix transcriptional regulator [Eggerthellaceae bacterium]
MNIEEKRQALGDSIRNARTKQGLSQQQLAHMIGSSKSHIWRIEKGRVGVGLDDLVRIAEALGVEVRFLLTF